MSVYATGYTIYRTEFIFYVLNMRLNNICIDVIARIRTKEILAPIKL